MAELKKDIELFAKAIEKPILLEKEENGKPVLVEIEDTMP